MLAKSDRAHRQAGPVSRRAGMSPRGGRCRSVTAALLLLATVSRYDHSQNYNDFVPFYARVGDTWTNIDYSQPLPRRGCGHWSAARRSIWSSSAGPLVRRRSAPDDVQETVQNLGVLTPHVGTDGGPTARRPRDPVQASCWRSRSEPSASDERLVVTSACAAVRSFAGATATVRVLSVTAVEIGSSWCRAVA